jgi:hypothetical protein
LTALISPPVLAPAKIKQALEALSPAPGENGRDKTGPLPELMTDYIDGMIGIAYKGPILDIVAAMQKSKLAAMAEAMVSLTAPKRHVSTGSETVGGPADAAPITKGDGFIWIKRKTQYDRAGRTLPRWEKGASYDIVKRKVVFFS